MALRRRTELKFVHEETTRGGEAFAMVAGKLGRCLARRVGLPTTRFEEGRVEHLLDGWLAQERHTVLCGEESDEQRDAQVRCRQYLP